MIPPVPEPYAGLFGALAAAFAGLACVLAFLDRRDKSVEAKVMERIGPKITDLQNRVDRLEKGRDTAIGHIVNAIEITATIPGADALRRELRLAAEALH